MECSEAEGYASWWRTGYGQGMVLVVGGVCPGRSFGLAVISLGSGAGGGATTSPCPDLG